MKGIQNWGRCGFVLLALALEIAVSAQLPGESWQRIGLLGGNITAVAVSPSYDADQTLFAGVSGAGLWFSNDRGVTWKHAAGIPNNGTVAAIVLPSNYRFGVGRYLFVGLTSGRVISSLTDGDTIRYSTILKDRTNTTPVPVTSGCVRADNELFWGTSGGGIYESTNNGSTYTNLSLEVAGTADCRAISANVVTGKVLAACYTDKNGPVWEWVSGQTWLNRGPSNLVGVVPTAIHISASKPDYCYLGTANRGMWSSGDKGLNWAAACDGSSQATAFSVGAVAGCPNLANDGEVWEGRSDGLRTSMDGGATCGWGGLFGSVTGIGFCPSYHQTGGKYCDVFVATTAGLFLRTCDPPKIPVTAPPAIAANQVAMAKGAVPDGTWAGSSLGLLRNTRDRFFLQYNASGAFNNRNPDVVAICLPPAYVAATCSTASDKATLIIAERTLGVFRTRDNGATWRKLDINNQGASTWPAGVTVNDLAIAPNYLTGATDLDILFAATSQGLYRWEGVSVGWVRANEAFPYNVTRVALPSTYDKTGTVGIPRHLVVFASDNYTDPKTGQPVGLLYSDNDGARIIPFVNAVEQDITSIGFAPVYSTTGKQIFYTSPSKGVNFTDGIETNSLFCAFNAGLTGKPRDVDVSPAFTSNGAVRLVAATSDGPFYCDFDPGNSSFDCSKVNYNWYPSNWNPGASGCKDTLAVSFAFLGTGQYAALGTSQDGVFWSGDEGATFKTSGIGYGSLPDDIYNILPHRRDDRVVFAASPLYGAFVSRDKGASFRPWNAGGTSGPCVLTSGWGLGMMPDRTTVGGDVVWVGMGTSGIKYRPLTYDTTNGILLDNDHWYNTTQGTGRFERFETLGWGQASKVRATSPTLGFYFTAASDWYTWTAENGTLPDLTAKSIRYGYAGADPVALASGQTVSSSVGQSLWKYYTFQVPQGTNDLRFFLNDPDDFGSNDPDMYIKYGAPPNLGSWDYRPYTNGDETVCVLPTAFTLLNENFEGTWGPYLDVPPSGWTSYLTGSESPNVWNNNDWHKYYYGGAYLNTARVYYTPAETNQYEGLLTPARDIPAGALNLTLEFDQRFYERTGGDTAYIYYRSTKHPGWTNIYTNTLYTGAGLVHTTLDVAALIPDFAGDTNVQFLFYYYMWPADATYGYWIVDNVKVSGSYLNYGTWWVGVNGYSAGASAYELTATLNSGCTFAAAVAGEGKDFKAAEAARIARPLPEPDAPTGTVTWGTISRSGSGGVFVGTDSTPLAGLMGELAPAAMTWEARNGTGAGALTNLYAQCVLELSDLTLVAGCNGGVFYSPAPDEGRTTWVESTSEVAGTCSRNFTDILECSNGDLLIAANGTTDGGTWLSGDKGRHWMKISQGFDSASQQLQDLVSDTGAFDDVAYYAGTDTTGAYTRTITAAAYPTVTALSAITGPASGGGTITVTGTGFSNTCPTGNAGDCPDIGPTVLFGETPATSTTYASPTSLSCTVPAHAAGSVVVTVRNPDTRQGGARAYTFTCAAPISLPTVMATDEGGCADSGVTVTWDSNPGDWGDGDGGTRTYDVLRNGVQIAGPLASGTTSYTDTTGTNGTAYTYQVRYRNGCGLTTLSSGVSGTDWVTPGAPAIITITDQNACAQSGIQVYFTAGGGATQHALYRGGVEVVANYKSGDPYIPGSTASYSYSIRATAGSCATDSPSSSFADADNTPAAPASPGVADVNVYALSGVSVSWSPVSGATGYDLYVDGTTLVPGVTSPYTYSPGNSASHSYQVRAKNACTGSWSLATAGADLFLVPVEVPNTSFVWSGGTTTTLSWSAATGATGYRVYRGDQSEVKNIATSAKVCLGYEGAEATTGVRMTATPAPGTFYWYLVVAINGAGEGSPGSNRVISSTGNCSTP